MRGKFLHQSCLRCPYEARHVGKAAVARKVGECNLYCFCFTRTALCAELLAFLEEILQELIACEHILFLCTLHGDQPIAHNEILVAFCLDFLFDLRQLHLAAHRIGEFARPCVLCAVRDVFCTLIEEVKMRLAKLFVRSAEPVDVKRTCLEVLNGNRCVPCDDALPVLRDVAHMRLEVITAACHAAPAKVCLDERNPLRRVHRCLDEALLFDTCPRKRRL